MHPIQMVDLKSQYTRIKSELDMAIQQVIDDTAFIQGPQVKQFAAELAEYCNVPHVIPCANGTDALQIALMAIDAQPGDEVVVPTFTYIATVEVIALLQLKPVFIDVDPDTFQLDVLQLEALITPRTKAIVPVHLYGQCSDMESIMAIGNKNNVAVIEDTAQAIGSQYRFKDGTVMRAGTIGSIGTTSFFPSKNLGCYGDGGALFTRNESLAKYMQMICNHGQSRKYYHDSIGVNSRLDTLQAAILSVKLKQLDGYTAARNQVAERYDAAFAGHKDIQPPKRVTWSDHMFHQFTIKVNPKHRDVLQEHLKSHGIPSMIYYPLPVHLQQAYTGYGYKKRDFPVAEYLCESVLSLPIHTEMVTSTQEYIIENVLNFFK